MSENITDVQEETESTADESPVQLKASASAENSKAVTVYEGRLSSRPATIKWLDLNFDLKVPPSNWMRASSPLEKYILKALYSRKPKKSAHMSSIAMAHSNVELVDMVDVISDAKNIKRLLEIPFAGEQPLSLMIHRVGKTLLIDEFDIHKHLLRRQQDDWKWMREFFNGHVKVSQYPPRVQQTQERLNEKNIFSKLLYHSILVDEEQSESCGFVSPQRLQSRKSPLDSHSESPIDVEEENDLYFSDDSELGEESDFSQQMEWKFEDIKMMIGTDLPIFSDDSSCVSLRLRDSNSPITVLTGLEYWLDNLMCNVPEIAMCYHQNGFVQKYERLNTADIPHLKGSEFKPEFVKDIAQNILSFLRSNATKIGHTYWLYKEKKGDIVKLYDLTSLTNEEQSRENPFRHPLAHLLFKVALKLHKEKDQSKSGVIQALLTNCLLLAPEARSQIAVTAHIILSQLYTREDSAEISTDIFTQHQIDDDTLCTDLLESKPEEEAVDDVCSHLDLASLSESKQRAAKAKNFTSQFPPISGTAETRCDKALTSIAEGLKTVDQDIDSMEDQEVEVIQRSPSVAIPLSYQPLTKDTSEDAASLVDASVDFCKNRLGLFAHTWHRQSKADLLSKAMYCCYTLAAIADQSCQYGRALKYIKVSLLSYDSITLLDERMAEERQELFYLVVRLCGDVQLKMRSDADMDVYSSEYKSVSLEQDGIINSTLKDISTPSFTRLYSLSRNAEHRLLTALVCYRQSQKSSEEAAIIVQRLGNCCNELGQFYTGKAKALIQERDASASSNISSEIEKFLTAADKFMNQSLDYFNVISDKNNLALVTVNIAKILRLRSRLLHRSMTYTKEEQQLHKKMMQHYEQALSMLSKRDNSPHIWDLVIYEQMEAILEHSLALEDRMVQGTSRTDADKELTAVLFKLLQYYESIKSHRNAAAIHHRLGLKLDSSYRECLDPSSSKSKRMHNMAESHYEKALSVFSSIEDASPEVMRIVVDRIGLWKHELDGCSAVNAKRRHLETGLKLVVDQRTCRALEQFCSEGNSSSIDEEILVAMLKSFVDKLQFITHSLVKSFQNVPKHRKTKNDSVSSETIECYKSMYRESLRIDVKETSSFKLSQSILQVCRDIRQLCEHKVILPDMDIYDQRLNEAEKLSVFLDICCLKHSNSISNLTDHPLYSYFPLKNHYTSYQTPTPYQLTL
ncbi:erythroid differentiation-related factor 1-like [Watersipora subatra]|uniref:erythroid differentiation-related factor 1-like n=1 Tax=Watersipora subatra TaxID=2589382 RepID=UPI00355C89E8